MKKLLLFIINFCFVAAMGQNLIAPITISLPANPPANTADWATAMPPVMIMAQTKMQNGQIPGTVIESKILVTIKSGGSIICGSYNPQSAPQSNFNSVTKTWSGAAVLSLLGKDCILKPGTYELCVQFYGRRATPAMELIGEACKSFTIADTKQQTYSPPQNIVPVNGKVFTEQEATLPIMFRWTPVLPKPKEDVLYKVRLYEVAKGTSKAQAIKSGSPVETIEVKNITQTSFKLAPRCNNCEWVWNVEASKKSAMGDIEMLGTSEATSFSVKPGDTNPEKFNPPVNQLPVDGKVFTKEEIDQPIRFTWSPVTPTPKEGVLYKVRVVEIKKGQPRAEALRTNTPIEILEVKNLTQVSSKLSKRCNNCEYIWNVEAVGTERVQGENPKSYGTSEATSFSVQSADVTITNFHTNCGNTYGSYTYTLTAENPGNNPFNTTSILFSSPSGVITAATFTPPSLNTVINPGSANAVTFTGGFNYAGTYPAAVYTTINGTQLGNINLPSSDTEADSINACICHDCDNSSISWNGLVLNPTSTPGVFNASGSINISGLTSVYAIEMQVQSYGFSANPSACTNGITSLEQSGVILQQGTTINNSPVFLMNETVSGLVSTNNGISKNIKLISNNPLPSNLPVNINIGLPAPLQGLAANCCRITYKFCIKAKVFYDKNSCKSCTFNYCFPAFTN